MILNDVEPPLPKGFIVNLSQFLAAAHTSTVNCDEKSGDGPKQFAYEMVTIKRKF